MSEDPYSPPGSDLGPPRKRRSESIWWKLYFNISALLLALSMVTITQVPELTMSVFDRIDIALSMVALVGLFGFAYSRPIARRVFWQWFFYLALVEGLIYSILMPLLGQPRYGELTRFDLWYLFEIGYAIALYCALYQYAFKRNYSSGGA